MKRKIIDFYDANMFRLHDMHAFGKRHGFPEAMIEDAMERYYHIIKKEYPELGRLPHGVRIDIARRVRDICNNLKYKDYRDVHSRIEFYKSQNREYRSNWIGTTIVLIIFIGIFLAIKILEN